VQAGLIRGDEKYLSQLVAHKGYEDPLIKFNELQKAYASTLKKKFATNKVECLDIHSFLPAFIQHVERGSSRIPVTYPGFLKSRLCTVMNTGLAIEIADIECSDDLSKVSEFVSSPNWDFFVRTCSDFGFMIDENVPWRLVADISPRAMLARKSAYLILPTNALLSVVYQPAGQSYYVAMSDYLLKFYNATRRKFVRVRETCNGKVVTRQVAPERYSVSTLYSAIGPKKRMAIYCALRLAEQKPELSHDTRQQIIDDCLEMYESTGLVGDTLARFETFISKTFDKVGSYSYLNSTLPLKVATARAHHPRRSAQQLSPLFPSEKDIDFSDY